MYAVPTTDSLKWHISFIKIKLIDFHDQIINLGGKFKRNWTDYDEFNIHIDDRVSTGITFYL